VTLDEAFIALTNGMGQAIREVESTSQP